MTGPIPASPNLRRWATLMSTTLHVGLTATALALAAGLPLAMLLARADLVGRRALTALMLLAACLPLYVGAVFTLALVPAVHLAGSPTLCGVVSGILLVPLATFILRTGLSRGTPALEEQALLDAAPWQVATRVVLPQARGAIAATGVLLFVLVSSDALISDLLAVRTFAEEVYAEFILDPARVGPVLSAIPMTVLLGLALLSVLRGEATRPPADPRARPITLRLGSWATPTALVTWGGVLVAALTPLYAVGSRIESVDALAPALRAAWPAVFTSLFVGVCTATVVAAASPGLGTLILARRRSMGAIGVGLVVLVATPAPVVGVGLVRLFNRPGPLGEIYDSRAIVVIGHIVRFLAFGVALLIPALARVPQSLIDAARIDGCGWLALQRRLIWPLTRATIALAWLVALLLSFAEVNVSKLVAPPGCETAAGLAFTLLHFGVYSDLAVLALLSMAAVCGIWSMLVVVLKAQSTE